MSADRKDGFILSLDNNGRTEWIWLQSKYLDKAIAYCKERHISEAVITRWIPLGNVNGVVNPDLSFLKRMPFLKSVNIFEPRFYRLDALASLPNLRELRLRDFVTSLDLSTMPHLTFLDLYWSQGVSGLAKCRALKTLCIVHYKPASGTLSELPPLPKLEHLIVVQSNLQSLKGLERFPALKCLTVAYCPKLACIDVITETKLEWLEVNHCKRIENWKALRGAKQLRKMLLGDSGEIPSLDFIKQMHSLTFLSFVGTRVVDGDMTPLFHLKEYAGFDDKRGYSHRVNVVNELINSRKPRS